SWRTRSGRHEAGSGAVSPPASSRPPEGAAMNITTELLHIVEQAHSLERILDAATHVIANRLRVDGCFVFLLDERGGLIRRAAFGPSFSRGGGGAARRAGP